MKLMFLLLLLFSAGEAVAAPKAKRAAASQSAQAPAASQPVKPKTSKEPASRPTGDAKPYNPGVPDFDHPNNRPNPEKPVPPPAN